MPALLVDCLPSGISFPAITVVVLSKLESFKLFKVLSEYFHSQLFHCLLLCVFIFMCHHVSILLCAFFPFFLGCLIHCHVQFVACTFVTCSNKDQSINQSIKIYGNSYLKQS